MNAPTIPIVLVYKRQNSDIPLSKFPDCCTKQKMQVFPFISMPLHIIEQGCMRFSALISLFVFKLCTLKLCSTLNRRNTFIWFAFCLYIFSKLTSALKTQMVVTTNVLYFCVPLSKTGGVMMRVWEVWFLFHQSTTWDCWPMMCWGERDMVRPSTESKVKDLYKYSNEPEIMYTKPKLLTHNTLA